MKKLILTTSLLFPWIAVQGAAIQAPGIPGAAAKDLVDVCRICPLTIFDYIVALFPMIVFLFVIVVLFSKLQKEGYKIGDALKENVTVDISEDNPALAERASLTASNGLTTAELPPAPNGNVPPFAPKTIQPKSISRLIAFISGLISVGLACCISSFWIYRHLEGKENIDLAHLTNVLLALGIGVIPYAVNKLSTGK